MLTKIKNTLAESRNELNYLTKQKQEVETLLDNEILNLSYIEQAQEFLQEVAKETQNKLSYHISEFVSSALESVWEDDAYSFQLNFVSKRNKTEVEMLLLDDRGTISLRDLNNVRGGGGVLDVIAFALRISLWSLQKNKEKLIILDQPFTNLDNEHLPLANKLLKEVNEKLGIQIIAINHNPLLDEGNTIYEVYKEEGVSKVIKK